MVNVKDNKDENYDYDNIDFLLDIYYDFIYRKVSDNQYMFKPISTKGITLNNLKKSSDFNPDNILKEGKMEYEGYWNERFHFKRKSNVGHPCDIAFGYYDSLNSDMLDRGVLYNMGIMYIMSEVVATDKFKHCILPVMLFDISFAKINDIVPEFRNYMKKEGIENSDAKSMYCLITEHFFSMNTLSGYLGSEIKNMLEKNKTDEKKQEKFWKSLFFQVLYSLYIFNQRLSQFRHNRLNLEAVKVYIKADPSNIKSSEDTKKNLYKVGSDMFYVPDSGFDIKICDFDYATTTDYINNVKVGQSIDNPYYDVHYFFNHLINWIEDNKIDIPQSVSNFLMEIVPEKLRSKSSNFTGLNETDEYFLTLPNNRTIPALIIKNNMFFHDIMANSEKKVDKNTEDTSLKGGMSSSESPRKVPQNRSNFFKEDSISISPISEIIVDRENMDFGKYDEDTDIKLSEYQGEYEPLHKVNISQQRDEYNKKEIGKDLNKTHNKNENNIKTYFENSEISITENDDLDSPRFLARNMNYAIKKSGGSSNSIRNSMPKKSNSSNSKKTSKTVKKNSKSKSTNNKIDAKSGSIFAKKRKDSSSDSDEFNIADTDVTGTAVYEKYMKMMDRSKDFGEDNEGNKDNKKSSSSSSSSTTSQKSPKKEQKDKKTKSPFDDSSSSSMDSATSEDVEDKKTSPVSTPFDKSSDNSESDSPQISSNKSSVLETSKYSGYLNAMNTLGLGSSKSKPKKPSKKSKKGKSRRSNNSQGNMNIEKYLGSGLAKKISGLSDNMIMEVPAHIQALLPGEHGGMAGPDDNDTMGINNIQNPMSSMLGFNGMGMSDMPNMPNMDMGMGMNMQSMPSMNMPSMNMQSMNMPSMMGQPQQSQESYGASLGNFENMVVPGFNGASQNLGYSQQSQPMPQMSQMPMQGMSMQDMQSMPMQGMPMQGMPMQGMPMQGMIGGSKKKYGLRKMSDGNRDQKRSGEDFFF